MTGPSDAPPPEEAQGQPASAYWDAFPTRSFVLVCALLLLACGLGLVDMARRWFAENSYYGHGAAVPLVFAWIVWREREALTRLPRRSHVAGVAVAGAALPVLLIGLLEDMRVLINLAFLAQVAGVALVFFGERLVRRLWFAFAFLIFMVPLPTFAIEVVTFRLKLVAAKLSVALIHVAGVPALLDGGQIHLRSTSVVVEDVCSGLRTLVTLLAFAVVFAYLQRGLFKRALVLVLAAPVAIVANVFRILILCWFASIGSEAAFEGPLHDATGIGVYALAILLFLGISALPFGEPPEEEAPAAPSPEPVSHAPPARKHLAGLVGILGVGAAFAALILVLSLLAPETEGEMVTPRVPAAVAGWTSSRVELGENVYRVLGTRDVVMRRYSREGIATPVNLYVTHAAGDVFRVAHPPERCFAGGGYVEQERSLVTLRVGASDVPANRILFRREGELVLVYYWYRLNDRNVASYADYRVTSFMGRFRDRSSGSMVRLSTPVDARGVERAEARLRAFVNEALDGALAPLSG